MSRGRSCARAPRRGLPSAARRPALWCMPQARPSPTAQATACAIGSVSRRRSSTTRPASSSSRWDFAFRGRMRRAPISRRDANARRSGVEQLFAIAAADRACARGRMLCASLASRRGDGRQRCTDTCATGAVTCRSKRRPRVLPCRIPAANNAWLTDNPWFEAELLPVLRREVRKLLRNLALATR